jgi:hypothetical protein
MLYTTLAGVCALSLLSVWIVGVAVRVKARVRIAIEECIPLIFACVLLCAFFRLYGDARYLFQIEALGILFAPYSLYRIWLAIPVKFDVSQKTLIYSIGIVAICIADLYLLSFRSYIADSYSSHYDGDLSVYFSSIPDSTSIFFYNSAQIVPLFHGTNYYQRIRMFDKWIVGSELAPIIPDGRVDMLVINSGLVADDAKISLEKYAKTADFGQISVYKRKGT